MNKINEQIAKLEKEIAHKSKIYAKRGASIKYAYQIEELKAKLEGFKAGQLAQVKEILELIDKCDTYDWDFEGMDTTSQGEFIQKEDIKDRIKELEK